LGLANAGLWADIGGLLWPGVARRATPQLSVGVEPVSIPIDDPGSD